MPNTKRPYQWDYDGSCKPGGRSAYSGCSTFSVGIFQWVPRGNGKGIKRGKVVQRVKGSTSAPDEVYAKAQMICAVRERLATATALTTPAERT